MKKIVIAALLLVFAATIVTGTGALYQSTQVVGSGTAVASLSSSEPEDPSYGSLRFEYDSLESDLHILLDSFNAYIDQYGTVPRVGRYFEMYMPKRGGLADFEYAYYSYLNDPKLNRENHNLIQLRIFVSTSTSDGTAYDGTIAYVKYWCVYRGYYRVVDGLLYKDGTFIPNEHDGYTLPEEQRTGVYLGDYGYRW